MASRSIPLGWALAALVASNLMVSVAGVGYTAHAQHKNNQRWCPLLVIADRPNPNRPPQTPDELEARRVLHQLRLDLGC